MLENKKLTTLVTIRRLLAHRAMLAAMKWTGPAAGAPSRLRRKREQLSFGTAFFRQNVAESFGKMFSPRFYLVSKYAFSVLFCLVGGLGGVYYNCSSKPWADLECIAMGHGIW